MTVMPPASSFLAQLSGGSPVHASSAIYDLTCRVGLGGDSFDSSDSPKFKEDVRDHIARATTLPFGMLLNWAKCRDAVEAMRLPLSQWKGAQTVKSLND